MFEKRFNLKNLIVIAISLSVTSIMFSGCDKDEWLSQDILERIPDEIMDKAKDLGFEIYGGKNPPNIEGSYFATPVILVNTSVENDKANIGKKTNDGIFRFSEQNNAELTILSYISEMGIGSDSNVGSFITGNGNKFSVFVVMPNMYSVTVYFFISGKIEKGGIRDLQFFLFREDLQGRLFKDEDGLAERFDLNYNFENGIHLLRIPVEDFKIRYWDKPKKTSSFKNYFNLGYFQSGFKEGGTNFTLPVANLVCDVVENEIPSVVLKYLKERKVANGKLFWSCNQNVENQFKEKRVSTLVVNQSGAHIGKYNSLGDNVKYAVSGAPVILDGKQVPWSEVASEGWGTDIQRNTWHGLLTVHDGSIIYIAIQSNWDGIYNKIKNAGFQNVIKIDGGGSFIFVKDGEIIVSESENRQINNIGLYY